MVNERTLRLSTRATREVHCEQCNNGVMISAEAAAAFTALTLRTIFRWVDEGRVHYTEQQGTLLVCLSSIAELIATSLRNPAP